MKTRSAVLAALIASSLLLSGCGTPAESSSSAEPSSSPSATTEASLQAADIVTIDDGIAWARGLDDNATATEFANGIQKIGELVPEQEIWFATSNEIGGKLITLNADVLADPENAAAKIDDLNVIVDEIEAAIEKGNAP